MSLNNTTVVLETIKALLLDNEELLQTSYYGLMKHAKQSGLIDKAERLYFVGDSYTINLVPQALLLIGWLALVGFLVANLGQEYSQSSHDSYSYYEPPASYHSPSISASYQPPLPYKAPGYHATAYSPPTSSYSAPASSYSTPTSSYSAPASSYSSSSLKYSSPSAVAYIAPSDHTSSYVLPSLTSYTIADHDENIIPELDTLSYGDTLSSDYKEKRDLYPIIQSRLHELQREIKHLQEANIIISQGELSNEGLQYSY